MTQLPLILGLVGMLAAPFSFAKSEHQELAASPTPTELPAVDATALDPSADPCQDFYQYACGNWLAKTSIPEDRPQWSRGFAEIDERNLKSLKTLLTDYSNGKTTPQNPYSTQIGDYYGVCMDEEKAETASMETLKEWMKSIDALQNKAELPALLAKLHRIGVNAFFDVGSEQDLKDPTLMIAAADQGGLGLPDRDYYLKSDPKMTEIQKQYQDHLKKMFTLLGSKPAEAEQAATQVYQLEKTLAQSSMDRVERRDPANVYHRLEKKGLEKLAPHLNWKTYFEGLGYPQIDAMNVRAPQFFSGFNQVISDTGLDQMKTYLRWHLLHTSSAALGKQFVDQEFDFYSKTLSGQKSLAPRWKRCINATNGAMGFAVGRSFVEVSYGKSGKEISKKMISEIEHSFRTVVNEAKWMDAPTRTEALKKLDRIFNKVGYPDRWRNYDALKVDRKSYLKNRYAAADFAAQYELNKIGKPVDRTEWQMIPSMVNAYYDPSMNEMVFPAGILQDPFFDPNASNEANYAGIGMVMGHELTHGFDDEGRKFDAEGKLRDWWSPQVAKEFDRRAECVIQQYNAFEVAPGLHVNGKLTTGENLADLGGIKIAYAAWKKSAGKKAESDAKKFFTHFAQTWCTKTKPELERMRITVDPHSPPKMRVNGPLMDFPEFSKVFGCSNKSPMNPPNHCSVW